MTGYYLEIGYCSQGPDLEEAWEILKQVVREICDRPGQIAKEAERCLPAFGIPVPDLNTVSDYLERYRLIDDNQDLTIFIEETPRDPGNKEFKPRIVQYASGGEPGRKLKEHLRRAFCRLVIEKMHKREIEVNLSVM